MRSSQVFAAVTVALGAIFLGICLYFKDGLGIPTEVFTGKRAMPEKTGPQCSLIIIETNSTTAVFTFICRDFEDSSIANDPTTAGTAMEPIIRMNQYGLNFTLETVNPTVSETCAYWGPDAYEDCDPIAGCGAAGFLLRTHHNDRLYHGTRRSPIFFYFTTKSGERKYASFKFQYTCDGPVECMLKNSCTVLREDTFRGYIMPRLWRVNRFNFEFTLTITDSQYS
jgi:hypothetical protein